MASSSSQLKQDGLAGRGCVTLDQLGLSLPRDAGSVDFADIKADASFNRVIDESHTSLVVQEQCERAWYLSSGLAQGISTDEQHLLRSLSSYLGGAGSVVHEAIRRVLDAHREKLNPEGRVLKAPAAYNFEQILQSAAERFDFMEGASWDDFFPNGRSDRDHPRFREHLKLKHLLVGSASPAHVALPETSPDHQSFKRYREVLVQALNNWHEIFYLDRDGAFQDDPRHLVPPGGLKAIDPALVLEVEEKNISYAKHDSFEILGLGGLSIPYYEIEVPVARPPVKELIQRGLGARISFRVKAVLDFVYLTFTPAGDPRLVAMDWKTNRLDEFSGKPAIEAQEEHLVQLKHYALYLLQRYRDVFQRFDEEIKRAFGRAHRPLPQLPKELTADMVFLGDAYIAGEGLSAPYRFRPVCAADLDLDTFVQGLRARLAAKAGKFSSIWPPVTQIERWAPSGLAKERCDGCNQAPLCPDAPLHVKEEWPVSASEMLSQLKRPRRTPLL